MFKASNPLTASRVHRVWGNEFAGWRLDRDCHSGAVRVQSGFWAPKCGIGDERYSGWWCLKHVFFFSPLYSWGNGSNLQSYFFRWVETMKVSQWLEYVQFFEDVNHKRKPSLKLTFRTWKWMKMDGWKRSCFWGWLPGRCELLVSGSVY